MNTKSTMMFSVTILLLSFYMLQAQPESTTRFHIFYKTHTEFSDHQAYYNGSHLVTLFTTDIKNKSKSSIHQIVTNDFLNWEDKGNVHFEQNIHLHYLAYDNFTDTTSGNSSKLVLGYYFMEGDVKRDAIAYSFDGGNNWEVKGNIPPVNLLSYITPMRVENTNSWISLTGDYEVATSQDLQKWNIGKALPLETFQTGFHEKNLQLGYVDEIFNLAVSCNSTETAVWVAFVKTENGTLYHLLSLLTDRFHIISDQAKVFDYGPDFFELAIADGHIARSKERLAAGTVLNKYYNQENNPDYPSSIISSIPRLIHLEGSCDHSQLLQKPAAAWHNFGTNVKFTNLEVSSKLISLYNGVKQSTFSIYAEIEIGTCHEVGFRLMDGGTDYIQVGYRSITQEAFLDRSSAYFPQNADQSKRNEYFKIYTAPIQPNKGLFQVDIFVDDIVVEVFFNTYEAAFTAIVFPSESANAMSSYCTSGKAAMPLIKISFVN